MLVDSCEIFFSHVSQATWQNLKSLTDFWSLFTAPFLVPSFFTRVGWSNGPLDSSEKQWSSSSLFPSLVVLLLSASLQIIRLIVWASLNVFAAQSIQSNIAFRNAYGRCHQLVVCSMLGKLDRRSMQNFNSYCPVGTLLCSQTELSVRLTQPDCQRSSVVIRQSETGEDGAEQNSAECDSGVTAKSLGGGNGKGVGLIHYLLQTLILVVALQNMRISFILKVMKSKAKTNGHWLYWLIFDIDHCPRHSKCLVPNMRGHHKRGIFSSMTRCFHLNGRLVQGYSTQVDVTRRLLNQVQMELSQSPSGLW